MRNPLRRSAALVGLDIGSTSVKLVELSQHDGRHRVEAFGVEPLPPNAVVERNIRDPERVGEAIRRIAARARPRARRAAAAVPDAVAITKTIEMDASLSDDALHARITGQADRHLPFPIEEVALDFEVQKLSERNPDQVEVLLAACRREALEQREAAMRLGGFRPHVVDIEGRALHRAAALARPMIAPVPGALLGVVDIGAGTTRLQVSDPAGPIYVQEQRLGGHQLCAEMQRRHGLSPEAALDAVWRGRLDGQPDILAGFRTALVAEIDRALRVFRASSGQSVAGLLLAGGAAALKGLAPALADALAAPVHVAGPFAGMSFGPRVDRDAVAPCAPAMLTACGLALRAFDP